MSDGSAAGRIPGGGERERIRGGGLGSVAEDIEAPEGGRVRQPLRVELDIGRDEERSADGGDAAAERPGDECEVC
ncbi:unnamed protein product [Linum tenue]|uniref:Uncharacterized protein n=1 Tax=Linum tenue TaxID=586396 RepID=A0AAV0PUD3_9ROSI|nr:unnamed protein product [Linum tenue]